MAPTTRGGSTGLCSASASPNRRRYGSAGTSTWRPTAAGRSPNAAPCRSLRRTGTPRARAGRARARPASAVRTSVHQEGAVAVAAHALDRLAIGLATGAAGALVEAVEGGFDGGERVGEVELAEEGRDAPEVARAQRAAPAIGHAGLLQRARAGGVGTEPAQDAR